MNNELERMLKLEDQTRVPVYLQAYRKLRDLITGGYLKKGEKLIGEARLAEIMNIGRTSLRTALVLLYEDGYVVTLHGKGTFVTHELPAHANSAPKSCLTMRSRLEQMGWEVNVSPEIISSVEDDAFLDEQLEANGQIITMVTCTYHIKDKPAVLSQMFFIAGMAKSIDELEKIFDSSVSYVTSSFTATSLKNAEFDVREFSNAKNVLLVSSVWYDAQSKPICYNKDYIDNDMCRYSICQSRDD